MKWHFKQGNILDETADVLICSANVTLNLSGGVGAELLERYGIDLQKALHQDIANRVPHAASQGDVFVTTPANAPYKAILHAVAVDPWYIASTDIIYGIVTTSLKIAAKLAAKKVTLAALGTGYGDLSLADFAEAIDRLSKRDFPPLEEVVVCLPQEERIAELADAFRKRRGGQF